ncbi:MAG: PAS domain-containing protein [Desulfobacteraceae bacterium]|nr:MAG: PAS domain-containing protein [Desulfobacteraceae bacterium]
MNEMLKVDGFGEELQHLKSRLAEAEYTLRAIRSGEVDALVVETKEGEQVFTLAGAEHPYRLMIEMMNEGSAILAHNGTIFYCNQCFSAMVKTPLEKIIGGSIYQFIQPKEKKLFKTLIKEGVNSGGRQEIALRAGDGTSVPILLSASNFQSINAAGAICLVATDISEQKYSEESLKKSEKELRIKTQSLEEVNAALKVLLKRVEEGRRELEEKILSNIRELVSPYIDKLKTTALSEKQITLLTIAETNLDHIAASFLHNLKTKYLNLTHREIQIATLVKEGKSVKDIAETLNITAKTVEFHRNSLRTKLGLKNKRANLRSHLLTFL